MRRPKRKRISLTGLRERSYLVITAAALSACTAPTPEPDPNAIVELSESELRPQIPSTLIGTSWRLLRYNSYESGIERQTPAAGEIHMIFFEQGGTLIVQLACNRGFGRWHASQREPDRGSLDIAPIDLSRAACPGARMNRIEEHLEYVGSYVISPDGLLTLNLRADSGNLVWKRVK